MKDTKEGKFKVLVTDQLDEKGLAILGEVGTVDIKLKQPEDELEKIVGEYDAWMVRSGTKVTRRLIEAGKNLKIIGRAGVGVDNVDVPAATERGIYVVNSPQGNTVAAAEHTLGLMFALARHIPKAMHSMMDGKWERSKFMGVQLQGKNLGVIGFGQVGRHVARVGVEMGMTVHTYDPYVNEDKAREMNVKISTLDEILEISDIITLHVPLMDSTKHLINMTRMKTMKPSSFIINASRGGVICESDLAEALEKKVIAGAALDVFEDEKAFPKDHPFIDLISNKGANLILTPHLGASTYEAQVNVAVDVALQIRDVMKGNMPASAVNLPGIRPTEFALLLPLLRCAKVLGRLIGQLVDEPVLELHVLLEGDAAKERTEPVLLSVAQGLLSTHTTHRVNFVNVQRIAAEFKTQLLVSKDSGSDNHGLEISVVTKSAKTQLHGHVTKEGYVLLDSFKDVPIHLLLPFNCKNLSQTTEESHTSEAKHTAKKRKMGIFDQKEFHMMYTYHEDISGALAKVSTALAEAHVNIANCHLGRKADTFQEGGKEVTKTMGLCIFHTDSAVPPEAIEKIRTFNHVYECKIFATPQTCGMDLR